MSSRGNRVRRSWIDHLITWYSSSPQPLSHEHFPSSTFHSCFAAGGGGGNLHHSYENMEQMQLEMLSTCMRSGESQKWNSSYKSQTQSHPYEDASFRFTFGGDTLYAVLDGHDGLQVAHFARTTLVSELCTGLRGEGGDMPAMLEKCILDVDRRLHQRLQPLLEERAVIKIKLAGAPNSYEAYLANPSECERLAEIEEQIKGGTTVAAAVIHNNVLYTANVGDSRIILCTYQELRSEGGSNVEFKVDQLTEDHTTANDNELDRLEQLGLNKQQIQEKRRVGSMETTRSIGDFAVKWGYKDFDILSDACAPPVIARPFCTPGIPVDSSFYFLFLMSDGVYHAVEEMSDCAVGPDRGGGSPDPNIRIANLLHEQFKKHRDCQKAADNVLDYICQQHFDSWSYGCGNCCRRDDMTLLVRLFNSPSKLYGHKRNHSGTIFRSSFSYCSSSDGVTPQPISSSSDLLADLSQDPLVVAAPPAPRPGTQSSMPPLTLTNALSILTPSDISVEEVTFDPAAAPSEPYIQLGSNFPDDSLMDFILKKMNVPENILEKLEGGHSC